MLLQKRYEDVADQMLPGDTLAFGGTGRTSRLIKFGTQSPVSHVAIVLKRGEIIEATTLADASGVKRRDIQSRIESYSGQVWWLPLSTATRSQLDVEGMQAWLQQQEGKPYDTMQAMLSAADYFSGAMASSIAEALSRESFAKLFCSELATGALKYNGVKSLAKINASEIEPIVYCRFAIYADFYCQLKGDPRTIPGIGCIIPERWTS